MAKKVTLDWTDPSPTTYVNQLEIWRKLDGGTYAHIGGAQLGDETYDDESGVVDLAKYYYEVRAYNIDRKYSLIENNITISSPYLLDNYTGSVGGYSLRKLKLSAIWGIEIRRSSGGTTGVQLDDNGSIDLNSIVSDGGGTMGDWVGANSAYVKTWYDQSGIGNDYTQTTDAKQPRIINAGVLEVESTLTTMEFNGSSDYFSITAPSSDVQIISVFSVSRKDSAAPAGQIWTHRDRSGVYIQLNDQDDTRILAQLKGSAAAGQTITGTKTAGKYLQNTLIYNRDVTPTLLRLNGIETTSSYSFSGQTILSNTNQIGATNAGSGAVNFFTGNIQEVVLFDADKRTDKVAIETEINDYYSIY